MPNKLVQFFMSIQCYSKTDAQNSLLVWFIIIVQRYFKVYAQTSLSFTVCYPTGLYSKAETQTILPLYYPKTYAKQGCTFFYEHTVLLKNGCPNYFSCMVYYNYRTASSIAQWQSAGFECGRSRVQSPVKDHVIPKTL